jgi:hypothetical protein
VVAFFNRTMARLRRTAAKVEAPMEIGRAHV